MPPPPAGAPGDKADTFLEGTIKQGRDDHNYVVRARRWILVPPCDSAAEEPTDCFLCTLETAGPEGDACFGGPRGRRANHKLQLHPFLFKTVPGKLCSECVLRVQYTREACRLLSCGMGIKESDKVEEWHFPSMRDTHANVLEKEGIIKTSAGDACIELICIVCSQEVAQGPLSPCACGLAYHNCCLERAFRTDASRLRRCPVCSYKEAAIQDEKEAGRMHMGYSGVAKNLRLSSNRKEPAAYALTAPASFMAAATRPAAERAKRPRLARAPAGPSAEPAQLDAQRARPDGALAGPSAETAPNNAGTTTSLHSNAEGSFASSGHSSTGVSFLSEGGVGAAGILGN